VRDRVIRFLLVSSVAALALAAPAQASQLIDRGATGVTLKVNAKGQALVEYRAHGRERHVLVWGAINARHPSPTVPQVKFKVDYSGGWGTYRRTVWKGFPDACRAYDGPKLAWFVTGCKAPDGSYWALQAWQVELPNLGFTPWLPNQRESRLMLSHWTGPIAKIEAYTDWVWGGRWNEVFGRFTYHGVPVYGYRSTLHGEVLDGYGRNLYLDTYDSAYGPGWRRENGFLSHRPGGNFCYGFYTHDPTKGGYLHPPGWRAMRPAGNGSRYRISVSGPGVTPDVMWSGRGLPQYDPGDPSMVALEQRMNLLGEKFAAGDKLCHQD